MHLEVEEATLFFKVEETVICSLEVELGEI